MARKRAKKAQFLVQKAAASPRTDFAHDSIANYVTGAGTTQDMTIYARPSGRDERLSLRELDALYQYNDVARRIVDEKVEDALRKEFVVRDIETNEPIDLPEHFDILGTLESAAKWGRAFGEGYVLLVEESEHADYAEPYSPENGSPIVNLIDFDIDEVTAVGWVSDPRAPGYGDPEFYEIAPSTSAEVDISLPCVHRSRLLRFSGAKIPRRLRTENDDCNDSVLQVVWDALRRFLTVEQGIALLVQRFEQATISIAGLANVLSTTEGEQLIQRRMRLMHQSLSTLHAALVDKDAGEEYSRQYGSVQGMDTVWDRMANSVSKAAKMPMTLLFGLSAGGLSSDDEAGKANWRKQVTTYQAQELAPQIMWLFYCLTGRPVWVEWPPADETTPKEEAEIDKLVAEADAININLGIYTPEEVRARLINVGKLVEYAGPYIEPPPDPQPVDPLLVTGYAEVASLTESSQEGLELDEPFEEIGLEEPEEVEEVEEVEEPEEEVEYAE